MDFPNRKYKIIYTDPPWNFNGGGVYQDSGRPVRKTKDQYPLMNMIDLKKLPVSQIAESNSLLFLWTTDQHIPNALELMDAWGFRFCTVAFYWIKKYHTGSTCYNIGCWTMKSVEQVLLGLKGKPMYLKQQRNVKQLVEAERTKHSKKPDEIRKRIVKLVGNVSRIELFAREKVEGWHCWGNEV